MIIFTHRGLEPTKNGFFPESSYEAFEDHLKRGFGIEFDPNFLRDEIIVWHDSSLTRLTNGTDKRLFAEISFSELKSLKHAYGNLCTFEKLLTMIAKSSAPLNALHLKAGNQTKERIDLLLKIISRVPQALPKLLVFDVKPEWAQYIKKKNPLLKLAPSVAHEYDIARYNSVVGETLISLEQALEHKENNLYDWVWLDEWDLVGRNNTQKKLYSQEVFTRLRDRGYKIALVTPELHATSPALLGGESHKDAETLSVLFARIKQIISLKPDGICTDYPQQVLVMMKDINL